MALVLNALFMMAPSLAIRSMFGVGESSANLSLYAEMASVAWSSERIKIIFGFFDISMVLRFKAK